MMNIRHGEYICGSLVFHDNGASSFQDMKSAIITPCGHFFHAGCLKKWLYVQETCPLCHCQLKNTTQPPGLGLEPVPQVNLGAEQRTVQQEATGAPNIQHQEGNGVEPVDDGQTVIEQDSVDVKEDYNTLDSASSSEASQVATGPEGLAEKQEEMITQDLRGGIQN